jgi:hypothetical protein
MATDEEENGVGRIGDKQARGGGWSRNDALTRGEVGDSRVMEPSPQLNYFGVSPALISRDMCLLRTFY